MFSLKRRPMKFMNFWNVSNQQFMVWLPIIYGFLDKSLLICSFWHGNESLVFMPKKVTVKKTCLKKDLSSLEHMNKLCNIIWFCKSRPETSIFQIFTCDKAGNNACFIKFRSKHSSNTVLCLLRNLMKQTLAQFIQVAFIFCLRQL